MDTREDTSMESHTDHRIEKWNHIERLSDIFCGIVGSSEHYFAYIRCIVLAFISACREYEEYRLVSHSYETVIHIWYHYISIPEESSSNRDTYEFNWRYRLCELWYIIEIHYIMYLYGWDLESIKESLALTVSYE